MSPESEREAIRRHLPMIEAVGGTLEDCADWLGVSVEAVERVRLEQGVRPLDTVPTGRKVSGAAVEQPGSSPAS